MGNRIYMVTMDSMPALYIFLAMIVKLLLY